MKKNYGTKLLSALLAAVMAFSLALPASAATEKSLKATYTGTKIVLDGEAVTPMDANGMLVEPFAVDGTTYLPIRAVANALGLGVDWDQATKTVTLDSGKPGTPPDGSQLAAQEFCAFGDTVATLYFPNNWANAVYMTNDIDNGSITFYDYANYYPQLNFGGWLFSLRLFKSPADYEYQPHYRFVQKITYQGATYYMVLLLPSAVEFDVEDPAKIESFQSKYEQIDSVVAGMVFSPAVSFPEPVVKSIKATYTGTKIVLDGQAVTPKDANGKAVEPFAVNGTTYLPIRAIANALGLDVDWDQATKTVTLRSSAGPEKEPTPAPTPEPTPEPTPKPASKPTPEPSSQTRTVYVTRTGKRYHYDGSCNGGSYFPSTLSAALSKGLTPCNKCVL